MKRSGEMEDEEQEEQEEQEKRDKKQWEMGAKGEESGNRRGKGKQETSETERLGQWLRKKKIKE